ncbi:CoA ester lyase [Brevibacterium ravenspurgense]|uniref:HpcH/HpaI aldolase/citrate lyase family protein n=1 Tax=Brevibacterium ravenspurgense TaxID=479117 RepID=UPI001EF2E0A3|nr:CoA ester lyase [Brevibacterium ravenspurgense]MCG7301694.1 CoA ester lyase [Brevibacterium ravenspurgense]
MSDQLRNKRALALPARLSRSWLFVNASKPELFASGQTSDADSIIFDLEAAVPDDQKDTARANVVSALENGMVGWVRVNNTWTHHWEEDLDALSGLPGLRGIMLPNTEEPEQVTLTSIRAGVGMPILALIETALGLENATRIASAAGTFRLAFGVNDFRKDTGIGSDPVALAYARSRLVIASRVGGLAGAIDGPSSPGAGKSTVSSDCAWTMKMGMTGKLVLSEAQVPYVNEGLAPSEEDREWAREMLKEAEHADGITDGSYLPRMARAKKIASLADSYGLWKS